jgi:mediator of RNA polymerase II transcription subunit 7
MADQPQPGAISAAFPAPPPFYKHFTPENLARLQEIQASTSSSAEEPSSDDPAQPPSSIDLDALPLELRYLIPPAPPTGQYRSFNTVQDVRPPSHLLPNHHAYTSQASPALPEPSPPDPQRLKTLTRSLLLHFLSLSHILATNPVDYPAKWDEIRDVFLEAHRVINEYRPHQARETLIQMMEEQVRQGREEIRICRETEERVREALGSLDKDLEVAGVEGGRKRKRERGKAWEERRVWEMLEREVGG